MTQFPQSFPNTRMRRLRQAPWVRGLVAENTLTPADLVWAVFVHDGEGLHGDVTTELVHLANYSS